MEAECVRSLWVWPHHEVIVSRLCGPDCLVFSRLVQRRLSSPWTASPPRRSTSSASRPSTRRVNQSPSRMTSPSLPATLTVRPTALFSLLSFSSKGCRCKGNRSPPTTAPTKENRIMGSDWGAHTPERKEIIWQHLERKSNLFWDICKKFQCQCNTVARHVWGSDYNVGHLNLPQWCWDLNFAGKKYLPDISHFPTHRVQKVIFT